MTYNQVFVVSRCMISYIDRRAEILDVLFWISTNAKFSVIQYKNKGNCKGNVKTPFGGACSGVKQRKEQIQLI